MSFKILVVDDHCVIRTSLRHYIERNPEWEVCGEVEDGQAAVEKVKELKPDVVILDLQMPVMNGIEAAQEITRIAPNTAMVMLTIHWSEHLVKEAQAVGIRHVLSKERGLDDLMASLRTVCINLQT